MRAWLAALLLAAPALAAGAGAPGGLPGGTCPAVAEPFAALRAAVQSDAGAPGDAADCRAGARPLGTQEYTWGLVEPGLPGDGAGGDGPGGPAAGARDLEDWFAQDLVATFGPDAWVMLNVSAALGAAYLTPLGPGLAGAPAPHQPFVVEAWPPGAAAPAVTLSSCGPGAWLRHPAAGPWDFRVRQLGPHEALPCIGPYLPGAPTPPPAAADYGVYRGCHPHCRMLAG